jgi:O-antigen/teichoic acid export membrane protein
MKPDIRRKGLIATSIIYVGFLIGALNNILLTKQGFFTTAEYGLTRSLMDIGNLFAAFASLGATSIFAKFFPYYTRHTDKNKNDLFAICLSIITLGLIVVLIAGFLAKPLVIKKFSENGAMLVKYFYFSFLITIGTLYFTLLEYKAWFFQHQLTTNFLREVLIRLYTLIIIVLYILNLINFDWFIGLFCFPFLIIAVYFCIYLVSKKQFFLNFTISKVTKKYKKQIGAFVIYGSSLIIVLTLKNSIDSLLLSSLINDGLTKAGIFSFAVFSSSLLMAPYRSLVSITVPLLSNAWRQKNLLEIDRLYKRTSINLLLFSVFAFGIIYINYQPTISLLNLNSDIGLGLAVFSILGVTAIIESGTGINGHIIVTSTRWRFEFYTNVLLAFIMVPCSYLFTKKFGLIGPALGTLVAVTVYNIIRIVFLNNVYKLQPFTKNTWLTLLVGACIYALFAFLYPTYYSWAGVVIKSSLYIITFAIAVIFFKLSPDAIPIINTALKKIGINKSIRE